MLLLHLLLLPACCLFGWLFLMMMMLLLLCWLPWPASSLSLPIAVVHHILRPSLRRRGRKRVEGRKELWVLAVGPKAHRGNEQQAMVDIEPSIFISDKLRSKQRPRSDPAAQHLPHGRVKVEKSSAFPACGGGAQARCQQCLRARQVRGRAKKHRKSLAM